MMMSINRLAVAQLTPRVSVGRTPDNLFSAFTLGNADTKTLHDWVEAVRHMLWLIPVGPQYLFLHDLRGCGAAAFGSEAQRRIKEIYFARPLLRQSVALVMPGGYSADAAGLAQKLRALALEGVNATHWEVFTSRKYAMDWLANRGAIPAP